MNPSGTILLTYASLYGSTQEVAQAIAAELRAPGLEVEVCPMNEVNSLDRYVAVILGAAIYNARWNPEAHRFVQQHKDALTARPVMIFALGPLHPTAAAMARSQRQLQTELARYPWLKPIATQLFVGKIDPAKLKTFERLGVTPSDERDWSAIRAWAQSLAAQFQQPAISQTPA